jgi:hypothetical protein
MLRKAYKEGHADKFALGSSVTTPITALNDVDVDDDTSVILIVLGLVTQPEIDHLLVRMGITLMRGGIRSDISLQRDGQRLLFTKRLSKLSISKNISKGS